MYTDITNALGAASPLSVNIDQPIDRHLTKLVIASLHNEVVYCNLIPEAGICVDYPGFDPPLPITHDICENREFYRDFYSQTSSILSGFGSLRQVAVLSKGRMF